MAFLIADGLVLAVLLIFACIGARRGLILSLCGLLAFVVAFLGASFAARTLSPVVADALEPKFAAAIEEQLNESIRQQAEAGEAAVLSPDDVPLEGVLDALLHGLWDADAALGKLVDYFSRVEEPVILVFVVYIFAALTFFPALALGPIAEHLTLWA